MELRQLIADLVQNSDLKEIGEELFAEEKCNSKDEYVENIRIDGHYLGGIDL